ncbi:uncharacterized protein [Leptinotarsa decemlineata]|uniref:uncharacterized protein n=1 Tax=Leptinotarsa decemlineata TaxID=7539 RepID=UPI003D303F54
MVKICEVCGLKESRGVNKTFHRKIRYFGDFESNDMEDNNKRNQCFGMAREIIRRQKYKIAQLQQKNRRMKCKINTLKSLTSRLRKQNMISENAECSLNASLSGPAKELFNRMLMKPGKQKYTPELRQFALTLNFHSTKSYNYVRQTF